MCPVNSIQLSVSEGKNLTWVSSEFLGTMYMCRDPPPGAQRDSTQVSSFIFLFTCREYWMSKKISHRKRWNIESFPSFL